MLDTDYNGMVFMAPHFGAWELLGLAVSDALDATLYKPGSEPDVDRVLIERRERFGANLVPANRQVASRWVRGSVRMRTPWLPNHRNQASTSLTSATKKRRNNFGQKLMNTWTRHCHM